MNIDAGITYQNAAGLQAVYLPANGTNQADINGGSPFIPAMQGFWIKTNATNASVSVDNTARITNPNLAPYNAPSFFRLSASTESSIKLKVSSSTCTDETLLRFTSATSNAYEGQSDCIKLKNNVNCPSLYTVVDHNEYSINSLSDKNITLQKIPLYLDATQNDDYSLDIKSSTLDPSIKIFVEDKKEGLIIPLSKPYVFKGNVKDSLNRFTLIFKNELITSNKNSDINSDIMVSANQNKILFSSNISKEKSSVMVTNILGQKIYANENLMGKDGSFEFSINPEFSGVCILNIFSNGTIYKKKINISK